MINLLQKWYYKIFSRSFSRSYRCLLPLYQLLILTNQGLSAEEYGDTVKDKIFEALNCISKKLPVFFNIYLGEGRSAIRWRLNEKQIDFSKEEEMELNKIFDQNQITRISSDHSFLDLLNKSSQQSRYKYGLAFKINSRYSLLILTNMLNEDTLNIFDLVYSIINQVQEKQALENKLKAAKNQNKELEKQLEISRMICIKPKDR